VPIDLAYEYGTHHDVLGSFHYLLITRLGVLIDVYVLVELAQCQYQIARVREVLQVLGIVEHDEQVRVVEKLAQQVLQFAHRRGAIVDFRVRVVVFEQKLGIALELKTDVFVLLQQQASYLYQDLVEQERHGRIAQLVTIQVHIETVNRDFVIGRLLKLVWLFETVRAELPHELLDRVRLACSAQTEQVKGRIQNRVRLD
jgi:hypothetical protein